MIVNGHDDKKSVSKHGWHLSRRCMKYDIVALTDDDGTCLGYTLWRRIFPFFCVSIAYLVGTVRQETCTSVACGARIGGLRHEGVDTCGGFPSLARSHPRFCARRLIHHRRQGRAKRLIRAKKAFQFPSGIQYFANFDGAARHGCIRMRLALPVGWPFLSTAQMNSLRTTRGGRSG